MIRWKCSMNWGVNFWGLFGFFLSRLGSKVVARIHVLRTKDGAVSSSPTLESLVKGNSVSILNAAVRCVKKSYLTLPLAISSAAFKWKLQGRYLNGLLKAVLPLAEWLSSASWLVSKTCHWSRAQIYIDANSIIYHRTGSCQGAKYVAHIYFIWRKKYFVIFHV